MDYKPLLEQLLDALGMSKKKFAESIGASQGNVSGWFNRDNVKPSIDVLKRISEVHNVNLNWLVSGKGQMFQNQQVLEDPPGIIMHLPVVASIAAGRPIEAIEQDPEEWLEISQGLMSLPPPYYAFKVEGDSMEPFIYNGDYVVLSRDWRGLKLQGKICGFRTWEGITLKRLMMQNRSKAVWLMPINHSKHEPMVYSKDTEELSMVGVLALVIRKFS